MELNGFSYLLMCCGVAAVTVKAYGFWWGLAYALSWPFYAGVLIANEIVKMFPPAGGF